MDTETTVASSSMETNGIDKNAVDADSSTLGGAPINTPTFPEGVGGDAAIEAADKGQLSPLTGSYILIVLGEPHCEKDRELIIDKLIKGLRTWNINETHIDLSCELLNLANAAPEGDETRYGEKLVQWASENVVVEVLIHPQVNTLLQCMKNLLASFTRHRHIIHAGYTFQGSGSWILQDGTFSFLDFIELWDEPEVNRILSAYRGDISVSLHCATENGWTEERLNKENFSRLCQIRINPDESLKGHSSGIISFVDYISKMLTPSDLKEILQPSDIVGNIRFSHPTLYVFPGGQGDAALFGINGFNMLIDGGFSRRACFWEFTRHLDRLDAVLLTRINNNALSGLCSVIERKRMQQVFPQIGHFFANVVEAKETKKEQKSEAGSRLIVSLNEMGSRLYDNLKNLNLKPHPCYRESVIEPINLYHKVGHGKLDMYILNPSKDSKEVREFLSKWHTDGKAFAQARMPLRVEAGREMSYPVLNMASICALIVWQPDNPRDPITRILFPGSTPQQKIFDSLNKLKHLEFLKYPVCSAKTIASSHKSRSRSEKVVPDVKSSVSTKTVSEVTNRSHSTTRPSSTVRSSYGIGLVTTKTTKINTTARSDSSSTVATGDSQSVTHVTSSHIEKEKLKDEHKDPPPSKESAKLKERGRDRKRAPTTKPPPVDNKELEKSKSASRTTTTKRSEAQLLTTKSSISRASSGVSENNKSLSSTTTRQLSRDKKSKEPVKKLSPTSPAKKPEKPTITSKSKVSSSKYGIGKVIAKSSTSSPPSTPPKSAKEATNRRVIESKQKTGLRSIRDKTSNKDAEDKSSKESPKPKPIKGKVAVPKPQQASSKEEKVTSKSEVSKDEKIPKKDDKKTEVKTVVEVKSDSVEHDVIETAVKSIEPEKTEVIESFDEKSSLDEQAEIAAAQNGHAASTTGTETNSALSSLDHVSINGEASSTKDVVSSETHTVTEVATPPTMVKETSISQADDEEDEYLIVEKDLSTEFSEPQHEEVVETSAVEKPKDQEQEKEVYEEKKVSDDFVEHKKEAEPIAAEHQKAVSVEKEAETISPDQPIDSHEDKKEEPTGLGTDVVADSTADHKTDHISVTGTVVDDENEFAEVYENTVQKIASTDLVADKTEEHAKNVEKDLKDAVTEKSDADKPDKGDIKEHLEESDSKTTTDKIEIEADKDKGDEIKKVEAIEEDEKIKGMAEETSESDQKAPTVTEESESKQGEVFEQVEKDSKIVEHEHMKATSEPNDIEKAKDEQKDSELVEPIDTKGETKDFEPTDLTDTKGEQKDSEISDANVTKDKQEDVKLSEEIETTSSDILKTSEAEKAEVAEKLDGKAHATESEKKEQEASEVIVKGSEDLDPKLDSENKDLVDAKTEVEAAEKVINEIEKDSKIPESLVTAEEAYMQKEIVTKTEVKVDEEKGKEEEVDEGKDVGEIETSRESQFGSESKLDQPVDEPQIDTEKLEEALGFSASSLAVALSPEQPKGGKVSTDIVDTAEKTIEVELPGEIQSYGKNEEKLEAWVDASKEQQQGLPEVMRSASGVSEAGFMSSEEIQRTSSGDEITKIEKIPELDGPSFDKEKLALVCSEDSAAEEDIKPDFKEMETAVVDAKEKLLEKHAVIDQAEEPVVEEEIKPKEASKPTVAVPSAIPPSFPKETTREAIRTPDEVADLPVHEIADPIGYDSEDVKAEVTKELSPEIEKGHSPSKANADGTEPKIELDATADSKLNDAEVSPKKLESSVIAQETLDAETTKEDKTELLPEKQKSPAKEEEKIEKTDVIPSETKVEPEKHELDAKEVLVDSKVSEKSADRQASGDLQKSPCNVETAKDEKSNELIGPSDSEKISADDQKILDESQPIATTVAADKESDSKVEVKLIPSEQSASSLQEKVLVTEGPDDDKESKQREPEQILEPKVDSGDELKQVVDEKDQVLTSTAKASSPDKVDAADPKVEKESSDENQSIEAGSEVSKIVEKIDAAISPVAESLFSANECLQYSQTNESKKVLPEPTDENVTCAEEVMEAPKMSTIEPKVASSLTSVIVTPSTPPVHLDELSSKGVFDLPDPGIEKVDDKHIDREDVKLKEESKTAEDETKESLAQKDDPRKDDLTVIVPEIKDTVQQPQESSVHTAMEKIDKSEEKARVPEPPPKHDNVEEAHDGIESMIGSTLLSAATALSAAVVHQPTESYARRSSGSISSNLSDKEFGERDRLLVAEDTSSGKVSPKSEIEKYEIEDIDKDLECKDSIKKSIVQIEEPIVNKQTKVGFSEADSSESLLTSAKNAVSEVIDTVEETIEAAESTVNEVTEAVMKNLSKETIEDTTRKTIDESSKDEKECYDQPLKDQQSSQDDALKIQKHSDDDALAADEASKADSSQDKSNDDDKFSSDAAVKEIISDIDAKKVEKIGDEQVSTTQEHEPAVKPEEAAEIPVVKETETLIKAASESTKELDLVLSDVTSNLEKEIVTSIDDVVSSSSIQPNEQELDGKEKNVTEEIYEKIETKPLQTIDIMSTSMYGQLSSTPVDNVIDEKDTAAVTKSTPQDSESIESTKPEDAAAPKQVEKSQEVQDTQEIKGKMGEPSAEKKDENVGKEVAEVKPSDSKATALDKQMPEAEKEKKSDPGETDEQIQTIEKSDERDSTGATALPGPAEFSAQPTSDASKEVCNNESVVLKPDEEQELSELLKLASKEMKHSHKSEDATKADEKSLSDAEISKKLEESIVTTTPEVASSQDVVKEIKADESGEGTSKQKVESFDANKVTEAKQQDEPDNKNENKVEFSIDSKSDETVSAMSSDTRVINNSIPSKKEVAEGIEKIEPKKAEIDSEESVTFVKSEATKSDELPEGSKSDDVKIEDKETKDEPEKSFSILGLTESITSDLESTISGAVSSAQAAATNAVTDTISKVTDNIVASINAEAKPKDSSEAMVDKQSMQISKDVESSVTTAEIESTGSDIVSEVKGAMLESCSNIVSGVGKSLVSSLTSAVEDSASKAEAKFDSTEAEAKQSVTSSAEQLIDGVSKTICSSLDSAIHSEDAKDVEEKIKKQAETSFAELESQVEQVITSSAENLISKISDGITSSADLIFHTQHSEIAQSEKSPKDEKVEPSKKAADLESQLEESVATSAETLISGMSNIVHSVFDSVTKPSSADTEASKPAASSDEKQDVTSFPSDLESKIEETVVTSAQSVISGISNTIQSGLDMTVSSLAGESDKSKEKGEALSLSELETQVEEAVKTSAHSVISGLSQSICDTMDSVTKTLTAEGAGKDGTKEQEKEDKSSLPEQKTQDEKISTDASETASTAQSKQNDVGSSSTLNTESNLGDIVTTSAQNLISGIGQTLLNQLDPSLQNQKPIDDQQDTKKDLAQSVSELESFVEETVAKSAENLVSGISETISSTLQTVLHPETAHDDKDISEGEKKDIDVSDLSKLKQSAISAADELISNASETTTNVAGSIPDIESKKTESGNDDKDLKSAGSSSQTQSQIEKVVTTAAEKIISGVSDSISSTLDSVLSKSAEEIEKTDKKMDSDEIEIESKIGSKVCSELGQDVSNQIKKLTNEVDQGESKDSIEVSDTAVEGKETLVSKDDHRSISSCLSDIESQVEEVITASTGVTQTIVDAIGTVLGSESKVEKGFVEILPSENSDLSSSKPCTDESGSGSSEKIIDLAGKSSIAAVGSDTDKISTEKSDEAEKTVSKEDKEEFSKSELSGALENAKEITSDIKETVVSTVSAVLQSNIVPGPEGKPSEAEKDSISKLASDIEDQVCSKFETLYSETTKAIADSVSSAVESLGETAKTDSKESLKKEPQKIPDDATESETASKSEKVDADLSITEKITSQIENNVIDGITTALSDKIDEKSDKSSTNEEIVSGTISGVAEKVGFVAENISAVGQGIISGLSSTFLSYQESSDDSKTKETASAGKETSSATVTDLSDSIVSKETRLQVTPSATVNNEKIESKFSEPESVIAAAVSNIAVDFANGFTSSLESEGDRKEEKVSKASVDVEKHLQTTPESVISAQPIEKSDLKSSTEATNAVDSDKSLEVDKDKEVETDSKKDANKPIEISQTSEASKDVDSKPTEELREIPALDIKSVVEEVSRDVKTELTFQDATAKVEDLNSLHGTKDQKETADKNQISPPLEPEITKKCVSEVSVSRENSKPEAKDQNEKTEKEPELQLTEDDQRLPESLKSDVIMTEEPVGTVISEKCSENVQISGESIQQEASVEEPLAYSEAKEHISKEKDSGLQAVKEQVVVITKSQHPESVAECTVDDSEEQFYECKADLESSESAVTTTATTITHVVAEGSTHDKKDDLGKTAESEVIPISSQDITKVKEPESALKAEDTFPSAQKAESVLKSDDGKALKIEAQTLSSGEKLISSIENQIFDKGEALAEAEDKLETQLSDGVSSITSHKEELTAEIKAETAQDKHSTKSDEKIKDSSEQMSSTFVQKESSDAPPAAVAIADKKSPSEEKVLSPVAIEQDEEAKGTTSEQNTPTHVCHSCTLKQTEIGKDTKATKKPKQLSDYSDTLREARDVFDQLQEVAKQGLALSSSAKECQNTAVEAIQQQIEFNQEESYRPKQQEEVVDVEEDEVDRTREYSPFHFLQKAAKSGSEYVAEIMSTIESQIKDKEAEPDEENINKKQGEEGDEADDGKKILESDKVFSTETQQDDSLISSSVASSVTYSQHSANTAESSLPSSSLEYERSETETLKENNIQDSLASSVVSGFESMSAETISYSADDHKLEGDLPAESKKCTIIEKIETKQFSTEPISTEIENIDSTVGEKMKEGLVCVTKVHDKDKGSTEEIKDSDLVENVEKIRLQKICSDEKDKTEDPESKITKEDESKAKIISDSEANKEIKSTIDGESGTVTTVHVTKTSQVTTFSDDNKNEFRRRFSSQEDILDSSRKVEESEQHKRRSSDVMTIQGKQTFSYSNEGFTDTSPTSLAKLVPCETILEQEKALSDASSSDPNTTITTTTIVKKVIIDGESGEEIKQESTTIKSSGQETAKKAEFEIGSAVSTIGLPEGASYMTSVSALHSDLMDDETYSSGDFSDSQLSAVPQHGMETDEEVPGADVQTVETVTRRVITNAVVTSTSSSITQDLENGNVGTTSLPATDSSVLTTTTVVTTMSTDNGHPTVIERTEASSSNTSQDADEILKQWGKPLGLPAAQTDGNGEINNTNGGPESGNFNAGESGRGTPKKAVTDKGKPPATPKRISRRSTKYNPIYVDLAYVPHHGNSQYCDSEFFRLVRSRYYVFSGLEPSRDVFEGLLHGKQTWEDKNLETTIIPTYDTDTLGYWVVDSEDALAEAKIDLAPSASRCTINLQDHETSCAAYRLEF